VQILQARLTVLSAYASTRTAQDPGLPVVLLDGVLDDLRRLQHAAASTCRRKKLGCSCMDGALNRAFRDPESDVGTHAGCARPDSQGSSHRVRPFAAAAPISDSVSSVCNLLHDLQPINCVQTLTVVALSSVACVMHWTALVSEPHDNDMLVLADMHPTPMPRSQTCGLSHLVLSEVGCGALPCCCYSRRTVCVPIYEPSTMSSLTRELPTPRSLLAQCTARARCCWSRATATCWTSSCSAAQLSTLGRGRRQENMLLRRAPWSPQASPGQLAVGVMVGLTTAGVIAATMAVLATLAGMQGPVRACLLTASGEVHCGAQTSCSSMAGVVCVFI